MHQTSRLTALTLGLAAATAAAQPLSEDFETSVVGIMPGAPWQDVTTRIDAPTVPSPTGQIIETLDAAGNQTKAFQINDGFGTSQGILAEIGPSSVHRVTADIRIDRLATDQGWPVAAGFIGPTTGATDFNQGVQAVVYADRINRWHLFVKRDLSVGQDQIISGATWKRGEWYNVSVEFDTASGALEASVINAGTGVLEGSRSRFVSVWKGNDQIFDAVAFFDGEYATGDKAGALITVDNINYVPAPGSAVPLLGSLTLLGRRRRR